MQTNFSPAQLADPDLAEADAILQTCVHYGFCTNTCPTYVLTRDENESPRGRIDLIRAMLEQDGMPDPKTVGHIDSCLSCLSCMTTCAVRVDYAHLVDRARTHIEQHFRRPLGDRLLRRLLSFVLPRPRLFQAAIRIGAWARGVRRLLPARLRNLLEMIPANPAARIVEPGLFRAQGRARQRVALLAGCAQQVLNGNINAATIRLLQRHDCDVVVSAGAGCCGSLALHMGRENEARAAARRNVLAWSTEPLDAIAVNASGCGTTVKDYGHLLGRDGEAAEAASRVASITRDITEILLDLPLRPSGSAPRYRVAYHDPCSMRHGQRVIEQPRELLRRVGFEVVDVPEAHFCCGSAGTYNLLQPAMATMLGQRKTAHIESTDPDIVVTGNIGCMAQIQRYTRLPVLHTVELLDWATGGPRPPALQGITLRDPATRAPAETTATAAPASDVGIW